MELLYSILLNVFNHATPTFVHLLTMLFILEMIRTRRNRFYVRKRTFTMCKVHLRMFV